jgi:hypothetical protein
MNDTHNTQDTEAQSIKSFNELADMSAGALPEFQKDKENIQLGIEKQRINHRKVIFYGTLTLAAWLFWTFHQFVTHPEQLTVLLDKTPFAISVAVLLGALPTTLVLSLIFSVYRPRKNEKKSDNDELNNIIDPLAKISTICRLLK